MDAQKRTRDTQSTRLWIARVLVAAVFLLNVQCALQFILWPGNYVTAYQVQGPSAEAIIRTVGICFLMWNVTYPPVILHPDRYRILFGVVIVQQVIGLVGESLLLVGLGAGLEVLAASITRFIAFDATGLVALLLAFLISRQQAERKRRYSSE